MRKMKRFISMLILVSVLFSTLADMPVLAAGQADIQSAEVQKTSSITLDGDLTEGAWLNRHALSKQIIGSSPEIDANFAATWDNENFYLGVEVTGVNGNSNFDNNSITYYFAPFNYRGTTYSSDDFQVQIFDKGTTVKAGAAGMGKNDSLRTSDITVKYKSQANGYTMEIAMPWKVVGTMPKSGNATMGFDIMAFSNGESTVMEWSGGNWTDTTQNGTLNFVCDGTEGIELTSKQPVFSVGDTVYLKLTDVNDGDSVAIFKKGEETSVSNSICTKSVTGAAITAGQIEFTKEDVSNSGNLAYTDGLTEGEYVGAVIRNSLIAAKCTFKVGLVEMITDKNEYEEANKEAITVKYCNTSGNDWIGLYKENAIPSSSAPAIDWAYTGTVDNTTYNEITFDFSDKNYLTPGNYKAVLLKDDGYEVKAEYPFTVKEAPIPKISIAKSEYDVDFNITVNYKYSATDTDWIGIYKKGTTPSSASENAAYAYKYATGDKGSVTFTQQDVINYQWGPPEDRGKPLAPGEYEFIFMYNDGYDILYRVPFTLTNYGVLNPPDKIEYNRTAQREGYADGTVTITDPSDLSNIKNYVLYWGDENGKLSDYNAITTLNKDVKTYKMVKNTYIPENATKLLAYSSNGISESASFTSFDIPEAWRISKDGLLSKFQVISDIHITPYDSINLTRFDNALKDIIQVTPDSDGIFANGDSVDTSNDVCYDNLMSVIDKNKNSLPNIYFGIGNHEYFEHGGNPHIDNIYTLKEKADKFISTTGAPGIYYDKYIGDSHFIVMGSEGYEVNQEVLDDAEISDTQFNWLESKLAETKDKKTPIFLFLHQSMADTVAGSIGGKSGQGWSGMQPEQEARLRSILADYPQVILFNGHSHWDMESPYEMYDGREKEASIFNTAAVCMLWTDAQENKEGSQGFYIEVFKDKILVRGRDFENKKWIPSAAFVVDLNEKYNNQGIELTSKQPIYSIGDSVGFNLAGANVGDSVAIFKKGEETSISNSICTKSVTGAAITAGQIEFTKEDFSNCSNPAYANGLIEGEYVGAVIKNGTNTITATCNFEVEILSTAYTVSISSITGGSIIANPATAVTGASISLTVIPDAGKQLKAGSLKYNDGTDHAITGTSFTMPAANVTVTAEFEAVPSTTYTVIFNLAGGTRTGGGELIQNVTQGGTATAPVVTLNGYIFTGWDRAFANVTGNLTVTAQYRAISANNNGGDISPVKPVDASAATGDSNSIVITALQDNWNRVEERISESIADHIMIDMNGSTEVPGTVFEALKGRDITMTFKIAEGIEWIINGKDLKAAVRDKEGNIQEQTQWKNINLGVTLNTEVIPAELINGLLDSNDTSADTAKHDSTVQLSLGYEGSFGFPAALSINMGNTKAGRIANLYYYNPATGKLELQTTGEIDKNGAACLYFTHASDYVILIDNGDTLKEEMDKITVTSKKTLYVGGTLDNTVNLAMNLPEGLKTMFANGSSDQIVTYKSSNPKVAIVLSSGKVRARKKGKTTITTTVTINGVTRSFNTTITVKKAYIKLSKSTGSLKKGQSYTYRAVGYGVDASKIIWSTTKKSSVIIDKATGKAKAESAGVDYVVAKAGSINTKLKVSVK